MNRSLVFATDVWGEPMIEVAREAERNGFHRLWTTERPGRDGLMRAAELALSTRRIGVGSGIVFAFTRNPVGMAGTVAELRRLSGGRFVLGLGTGTRGVRSRWYGESFEHPAPRLAEYADLVRAALAPRTDALTFDGEYYQVQIPNFEAGAGDDGPPVPVYGSGLNPTMLRIMARRLDGVAVHPLAGAPAYLAEVAAPALATGAEQGGHPLRAACWLMVAVDTDAGRAEAMARRELAFYFSTPSYGGVADTCGWGEAAEAVRAEFKRVGGDWDTVGRLVSPEMLDGLCPHGTPDDVAKAVQRRIEVLAAHGIEEVVFEPAVIGSPHEDVVRSFRLTAESLGATG
jgi:alkanesulfonate monooxygenase SsuD/methylene tetrahydromethanopterin reductase-like flavin-dependent oxidoreductase (luciferase family)